MHMSDTGSEEAVLQASMLGGLRLAVGGRTLTQDENRAQKLWSVLCYLLLHRDRSVPQSELIDLFWPEEDRANPTSALKTLLHRTRAMLESLFPDGPSPILSGRGSYAWNPEVPCRVDAEEFEGLCIRSLDETLGREQRRELCRQAEQLYQGDLLPRLSTQLWVVSLATHYHTRYVELVKRYAALLEEDQSFPQMEQVCARACGLDPLDEELQVLLIRSLLRQGKSTAALSRYEAATDLLYRNLGVRPSQALRDLYREIMDVEKGLETDLEVIQSQLQEAAGKSGAFVCEYGFFQQVYRLEARRAARNGTCIHIALLTVSQPGGGVPPLNVLNQTMDQLLTVITASLRRGDVVSRFSGAQYVLMLPGASQEDAVMVMDRILSSFRTKHRFNCLELAYKVRALDIN